MSISEILLVEDSPAQTAQVVSLFKTEGKEIRVTAVSTGAACLKALARSQYAAILLDYLLPDMDGLKILKKIREDGSPIPVIMVTGEGDEQIAVEAMKGGAADYVTKSLSFLKVLPIVVRQVLENEALKARLAATEDRLRFTHTLSLAVSLELDPERLARRLVEGIRRLTRSEAAAVFLLQPDSDEVATLVSDGIEFDQTIEKEKLKELGFFGLFLEKRAVIIPDASQDSRYGRTPAHRPKMRSVLTIPLMKNERILGGMLVCNPTEGQKYGEEDKEALLDLAAHASVAIENAHYVKRTETLAVTDSVTGLYNHGAFQKRLEEEVERARRYGRHFSLLLIDIDHFKSLNDSYGHQFGDAVLKKISRLLQSQIRGVDFAARYGGEELAVILPETEGEGALLIAERIRSRIFEEVFEAEQEIKTQVTVSVGLAGIKDADDRITLIAAADKALYIAKEAGRNRVCQYSTSFDKMGTDSSETQLEELRFGLLKNLASAVDAKSAYTRGQSDGIARLTMDLAKSLDLSAGEIDGLRQASLLHNVGTAQISGRILNKPTPLTNEEQKIIQAHPIMAEMLLKQSPHIDTIIPAVLYHHERYDGRGYPSGLKGEEIPFPARVLAVTSAYHAIISDRPYRKKRSPQEAKKELRKNAGLQFDPQIVEVFINMLDGQEKKDHPAK